MSLIQWLRKKLGLDKQQEDLDEVKSSLNNSIELLTNSLEELKGFKEVSNKNDKLLKGIEGNLETSFSKNYFSITEKVKGHLVNVQDKLISDFETKVTHIEKSISTKLENQHLKELEIIKQQSQIELNGIKNEVSQLLKILNPKPIPINFKLVDPLDNIVELFSFQKLAESIQIQNKTEVKNGSSILSNLVGLIPELTSSVLLSNSFRFVYPSGFSGKVMQMGAGQGTAIMQNGSIAAHGSYVANALIAAPLVVYSIGSMIIRQHYLNKINKKLEEIQSSLDVLTKLVFNDKRAKIEAIIYFYKKSYQEFDNVNTNLNYRNAVLTNLIAKNIEVYELIQFYANSIHLTKDYNDEVKKNDFENNVKSFLELQDLFLYGKLLTFMYSNLFDKELKEDLINEFKHLSKLYKQVLKENSSQISNILTENSPKMDDWIRNRQKRKENVRGQTIQDLLTIDSINKEVEYNFESGRDVINDLIKQIEKPQEFIIEKGELYQVN